MNSHDSSTEENEQEFVVQHRQIPTQQEETLETEPANQIHSPHGQIPNTPLAASTISFLLGGLFFFSLYVYLTGGLNNWWATPQLAFFLASWSAFHWGEFAVTAGWNRGKLSVDSFLLENGAMYHLAHSLALLEYLLTLWFKPSWKAHPYITPLGIILVFSGQILRSGAMIHASASFSHIVAHRKLKDHILVTDGIYAYFRHPSYAGFFYWALGTQLVLQNPFMFLFFLIVLWRFFSSRIKYEENTLIRFFGQAYLNYKSTVGTRIPFIP